MPPFASVPCSADDGPEIARVYISAFWTDPTWVIIWPGKSLDYVIRQSARRMPHSLLMDTTHRRHQKVIDTETGLTVGYARWTIPELEEVDVASLWSTARVPSISEERALEAEREYAAADYAFDHSLDELDEPIDEMMTLLTRKKKYISKLAIRKIETYS